MKHVEEWGSISTTLSVFQGDIVEGLVVLIDLWRKDSDVQALFPNDGSAYTSIAISKGVDQLKVCMCSGNLL